LRPSETVLLRSFVQRARYREAFRENAGMRGTFSFREEAPTVVRETAEASSSNRETEGVVHPQPILAPEKIRKEGSNPDATHE
jgi:hypothetical protein